MKDSTRQTMGDIKSAIGGLCLLSMFAINVIIIIHMVHSL